MSDDDVQDLSDGDADALVGTLDETDPIPFEPGTELDVVPVPDDWNSDVHADEYADDPLVVVTPDEDEDA